MKWILHQSSLILKVGDILETTNGEFEILTFGMAVPNVPVMPKYAAMFVDKYEIQYMSDTLDDLLNQILADGDLIEVRDY